MKIDFDFSLSLVIVDTNELPEHFNTNDFIKSVEAFCSHTNVDFEDDLMIFDDEALPQFMRHLGYFSVEITPLAP